MYLKIAISHLNDGKSIVIFETKRNLMKNQDRCAKEKNLNPRNLLI